MLRPPDLARHQIKWMDCGHPPQNEPDPRYPEGIDIVPEDGVDSPSDPRLACKVLLPYPTGHKNVGGWHVRCLDCGLSVYITAASRPDDPRSAIFPCSEGEDKR